MPDEPGEHDFEVPVSLFQDVEDLQAQIAQLSAQVKRLTEVAGDDTAAAEASGEEDDASAPEEETGGDSEWLYPPFILLLDPPEYDNELRALAEWVEGVLVPGYLGEPSNDARWCHLWFEHPVAIARLHALWLAWQESTDPAVCGYTGPSVWHRDHLDPCLRELRASHGPFEGCVKGEHTVAHRMPSLVPSAWRQIEK